ncbi:DUF5671 domain-containing protein [Microbacterium sp. TNHR37B]|uniref:DUF5671 domain-containing protein n=1 Tax=Microbacterium sp. TNHR37B TaxID=1775956 RepID=UPI0007B2E0C7|nr:DUF5671 domain-containing protein [Microbacterium sp. TNHR37B]KZE91830.1 hypothetical protein AVP41_01379 [Microbacterium sp. TNHR37B]
MSAPSRMQEPSHEPSSRSTAVRGGRTQGTVRRLIVFSILFVLVMVAATGVSGLLGRLLETRPEYDSGPASLALSLAFALIGGALAVVLWWFVWRRLERGDRDSVAWGLYLAAVSVVSLIVFTSALAGLAGALARGEWEPDTLAVAVTWLLLWAAHRAMWAHPTRRPTRLASVPVVLGAAYGLTVAAAGGVRALAVLIDEALPTPEGAGVSLGAPWGVALVSPLAWCILGAAVWAWYWWVDRARQLRGGFADVMVVLTGVLGGAVLTLGGLGVTLSVVLRSIADRDDGWGDVLSPLPIAVAAAAIGALIWTGHRATVADRSPATRSAARLVIAGAGLVGAASGIGVVINALLATFGTPLAGDDARTLLLGGIASLLVGAPVWWAAWRPDRASDESGSTSRRIYLVAVFGVSAVVAIIALLVVGYRVFSLVLDSDPDGFFERIRAPFGLLAATVLVAGYHFPVWRRERAHAAATVDHAIDEVVVVAGSDVEDLARAVRDATGARVTRWVRADLETATDPGALLQALESVAARRALVLGGAGGTVQVIPLAD